MPYSITRDDADKDARYLRDALQVLQEVGGGINGEATLRLEALADSIEEQLKPVIDEPTEFGSMVQARWIEAPDYTEPLPWIYTPWQGEHRWRSADGLTALWSDLTEVEVLRVGVGNETRWREIYDLATKNTRERIYNRITALKAKLITAPEKTAIDKALAEIEADVEDHEGPVYRS